MAETTVVYEHLPTAKRYKRTPSRRLDGRPDWRRVEDTPQVSQAVGEPQTEPTGEGDSDAQVETDVPDPKALTGKEIAEVVQQRPELAAPMLEAERVGENRSTVITALESVVAAQDA